MREQILSILRQTADSVSGEELSRRLGVSRSAVWKAVKKLRQEGYTIESATNRGYRLTRLTDQLNAAEIRARLGDHPWADTVQVLDEVDSTNNVAKALAAAGAGAGTVIVAESQTGGRGRRGRSFASPPGMGVYLSAILRPACGPQELMHLTCAVAVAMCGAVEQAVSLRPAIKWTNDLVYGGRKLAGILTELALEAESGLVQYAVVGIGVNCCQCEDDFPAAIRDMAGSLRMCTGKSVDRNALAAEMIRALHAMDTTLLQDRARIMDTYRRDCITLGKEVSILRGDEIRHAFALDVDEEGALLVKTDSGDVEKINSGEVSVRGLYGYV